MPNFKPAITQTLKGAVPSFLQADTSRGTRRLRPKSDTAYLDGMRGIAAFVVFVSHTAEPFMPGKEHGYGQAQNKNILQLPIIRLAFSGPPMVAIFFVISGFALTLKPLRLARDGAKEDLLDYWASAILRRGIRIFMPCLVTTLMVMVLVMFGVQDHVGYHNLPGDKERRPIQLFSWKHQFVDWLQIVFNDLINWWTPGTAVVRYDTHLWTIPMEFQASMIIFIIALALGGMETMIMNSLLFGLFVYFQVINMWHVSLFVAGMSLAACSKPRTSSNFWRQIIWGVAWIFSLFLLSFPSKKAQLTPGYVWLCYLTQSRRKWHSYGAVLLMYSTREIPTLQKPFTHPVSIYLGRISYALYLVHGPFLHSVGYGIISALQSGLQGWTTWYFEIGFTVGFVLLTPFVVYLSDVFCRLVDEPCVRLARRVDNVLRKPNKY